MPSFLRPSAQHCRDFLSHLNAYVAHDPIGYDLYFTLPFDLGALYPMRPQELETLYNFLDTIQHEVAESLGNHILENVLQVQSIISRRLENARCLGDLELQGWTAGHGFPVYNEFQHPVDFHWDWDVIEFEGLNSKYFNLVHPASAGYLSHSIYSTPIRYISPPPDTSFNRSPYGSANLDRMHSESGRPVIMYGATFANTNKCLEFLDSLTDCDLALLEDGIIQLEGDSHLGIRRIWGPNADSHFERVSRASRIDLETIEPTEIEKRNRQTKTEAKQHSSKHMHSWEDFYQLGLISYDMAAETNGLVPRTDPYLLKLYKAMRDRGLSERDAIQIVTNIKCIDPSSLSARPMRDDYSRWGEERSTYAFPNESGYDTLQVTVRQATPYSNFEEPAGEHYILSGSRLERVQHPGQGSKRRVQTVQPQFNREVNQSTFTKQPEPHCATYLQAPPSHRQPAIAHERDSLLSSGREGKRKVQIKDPKSMPESERKEFGRAYSKTKSQRAIDRALAAHESKKAKERSHQNITQQVTHFEDHKQQTPSSSSAQEAIKRSGHIPETVDEQALDPRHTMNGVNPNAYRTRSYQGPTRLFIRHGAATRPSSYHGGLKELAQPEPHQSTYQAYAEDSPEDSPRAAPGSWRDV